MNRSRSWLTPFVITSRTALATFTTLRRHRLGVMVPVVGFLLMGALFLWVVNTIAPLAPFVYSLF